ncbi:MAG TPA: DUF5995 family protein [Vicinamibacterales bacterium]|nr:DUF5995 family protein [Vicinamibacterales bacterium]
MLARLIGTVRTTEDVIATMRAIHETLPDTDGVKWFNFLYLNVTEAVLADTSVWEDWPFLQRFDVTFAILYFDAIVNWEQDRARTPHAWRPLLRARYQSGRAPIQFALAGMNAHINHDLAIALDRMAGLDGRYPSRDGARFTDFRKVNDVLERMEARLREQLTTGLAGEIDRSLGDVDSVVMMWNIRQARDAAWTNGEVLWQLRSTPHLQRDYLAHLDQFASFAGRGLLVPRLGVSAGT